ncbi:hypothetical protein [Leifsonia sp. Leaf264]|uniref:hypothetical protein n=1 Tax=Leifsonia sp. Leaf264 TaxID=1736314 RepID=UPI0006FA6391|nr:hypothetical protein [Leifsonia sp. Leaf264]KQP01436.1 hypothetical protein ASF30_02120 [Leifsonia sp. Leaf264]
MRFRTPRFLVEFRASSIRAVDAFRTSPSLAAVEPPPVEPDIAQPRQFPVVSTAAAAVLAIICLVLFVPAVADAQPSAGERDRIVIDGGPGSDVWESGRDVSFYVSYDTQAEGGRAHAGLEVTVASTTGADVSIAAYGPASHLLQSCDTDAIFGPNGGAAKVVKTTEDRGKYARPGEASKTVLIHLLADSGSVTIDCDFDAAYAAASRIGSRRTYVPTIIVRGLNNPTCIENTYSRTTGDQSYRSQSVSSGCVDPDGVILDEAGTGKDVTAFSVPSDARLWEVPTEQAARDAYLLWAGLLGGFALALVGPLLSWADDHASYALKRRWKPDGNS